MRREFHTILVIRLKYMGDVLLATPLFRDLRHHYPQAEISFLTRNVYTPLLEQNPFVDEVITIDSDFKPSDLLSRLREKKFDLVLDLSGTWRSAVLSRLTGAGMRLGRPDGLRQVFYNVHVARGSATPDAMAATQAFLQPLHIPGRKRWPEMYLTRDEREWGASYMLSGGIVLDRPLIAIHPGSRWENKIWPFERFVELVEKFVARAWQVIFVQGNPDEAPMLQRMMDRAPNAVLCADNLPLRRLASVLSQADVFVSNYSGLLHLGVAVGTRVVGIFGPDEPDFWFPYATMAGHQAVHEEIECRPCQKNYCPLGTLDCLTRVEGEMVFEAVARSLVGVR